MSAGWPGGLVRSVLLSVEALGLDPSKLAAEVKAAAPTEPDAQTPWDAVVRLLESFHAEHGVERTQALMQELASRHSSVRAATELLGSTRLTYLVLLEALVAGQSMLSVDFEVAGEGVRFRLALPAEAKGSLVFLQCCGWFLAAVPRARRLPDARLDLEVLTDRELKGVLVPTSEPGFKLGYPDSAAKSLARELFRTPTTPAGSRSTAAAPTTQGLQLKFSLTRAEARVVKLLADGRSMKRIAEELEVSLETARTHAKRAMQKTDTHRQAELVSLVLQGRRRRED